MVKIKLNREECIGCGLCASICATSFEMDDEDNKARVKKAEVQELTCEKEAEENCPVKVITIEE